MAAGIHRSNECGHAPQMVRIYGRYLQKLDFSLLALCMLLLYYVNICNVCQNPATRATTGLVRLKNYFFDYNYYLLH